jgi:hypothetical protein
MVGVTEENLAAHGGQRDGSGPTIAEERVRASLGRVERLLGARLDEAHLPAWLRRTEGESRLPVAAAILVAIALQIFVLPTDLAFRPWWLLPALEFALLVALGIANPVRINRESTVLRGIGLALVAVASWATAWSAFRLVYELLNRQVGDDPVRLLLNGGAVWFTNVIVFALWYWEIDRGGPAARANARDVHPDFLFAQMAAPELADHDWEPNFIDYLYLSYTNATAFSPTDTLPLSRWAKLAMMFQSAVSLATLVLVVARAVNILH